MTATTDWALVFGEVLFDCYQDRVCMGGAPLNFAWNLRQFGVCVEMASAVGRDDLGDQIRDVLRSADIGQDWVVDQPQPTGTVDVLLTNGEPDYTINENVAWDNIELKKIPQDQPRLLYFGTLAQRTECNQVALQRLMQLQPRHRFFDVNLRQHYHSPDILLNGLRWATILKASEDEWKMISQLVGRSQPPQLLVDFDLDMIAITHGAEGAELYIPDQMFKSQAPEVSVIDAVGGGDAFSAVLAAGVMLDADPVRMLDAACIAGAAIVQQRGPQQILPTEVLAAIS